jgi:GDP-L-fucose synthase
MTILVAGGSGLVGSAVVRTLRQANRNVIGISSNDVNLLDREKTFSFIQDLKHIAIIDAAAKVGGIGGNNAYPVEFLSQNLLIQTNLMDAAHNANVDKFVFLGSSCIYPKNSSLPIKEKNLLNGFALNRMYTGHVGKKASIFVRKSKFKMATMSSLRKPMMMICTKLLIT